MSRNISFITHNSILCIVYNILSVMLILVSTYNHNFIYKPFVYTIQVYTIYTLEMLIDYRFLQFLAVLSPANIIRFLLDSNTWTIRPRK